MSEGVDPEAAAPKPAAKAIHPWVWALLYVPFGALGGFISIALTFRATKVGLSISEGAMIGGAQLLCQWLKWIWAPAVDATLTPRKWYHISTSLSAIGVVLMAIIPMTTSNLPLLLATVATASFVNTVVGMSVEALMAKHVPEHDIGRASGWFQAGNLGGAGFGGALGLFLLERFPSTSWISGGVCGGAFLLCGLALFLVPKDTRAHVSAPRAASGDAAGGYRSQAADDGEPKPSAIAAMVGVLGDLKAMLKIPSGRLAAFLCLLPIGTGAAQDVLTQSTVAAQWHAGAHEVELLQGLAAGGIKIAGCFAGGYLCKKIAPQLAYALTGALLALVAIGMAVSPTTLTMYVAWNVLYAFGVGLTFSAFTAVALSAMGEGSGATKYSIFASLSNFPIWWLGLLLGRVADKRSPQMMLWVEAALGLVAAALFLGIARAYEKRKSAV
jgi:MFS transporter, PAT family, beta-lactamase induction signal transducer AmpG